MSSFSPLKFRYKTVLDVFEWRKSALKKDGAGDAATVLINHDINLLVGIFREYREITLRNNEGKIRC